MCVVCTTDVENIFLIKRSTPIDWFSIQNEYRGRVLLDSRDVVILGRMLQPQFHRRRRHFRRVVTFDLHRIQHWV
jgi:hypothetical protein